MPRLDELVFDNSFARLPEAFYQKVMPTPVPAPYRVAFNADAAALLGLSPDAAERPDFAEYFSGNRLLPGSEPLAALYAGHQFGHYVPQLGDGRAILLGEVRNGQGEGWELQLKGAGRTAFSRGGDGRAVLRSTIREYLCSEAMHGLGIPTTRALSIVGSDMPVYREEVETGAILTRMAPSHVRFGSFEVFFYRGQEAEIRQLADYVIERFYPEISTAQDRYVLFLEQVVLRTARLMAQWQAVGFAHGVMNTDNMSILGLTLDYGPFGFMERYDAGFICNHSDHGGRYAFDKQPQISLWNLTCLAQALTPLMPVEAAKGALERYGPAYATHYVERMCEKLGLLTARREDVALIQGLLALLQANQLDYTRFFRGLGRFRQGAEDPNPALWDEFIDRAGFDAWAAQYRARLWEEDSEDEARRQRMDRVNPKYILRNYLAERAIRQAADEKDFSEIERLHQLLRDPFAEQPEMAAYAALPPDWAAGIQVSCSS